MVSRIYNQRWKKRNTLPQSARQQTRHFSSTAVVVDVVCQFGATGLYTIYPRKLISNLRSQKKKTSQTTRPPWCRTVQSGYAPDYVSVKELVDSLLRELKHGGYLTDGTSKKKVRYKSLPHVKEITPLHLLDSPNSDWTSHVKRTRTSKRNRKYEDRFNSKEVISKTVVPTLVVTNSNNIYQQTYKWTKSELMGDMSYVETKSECNGRLPLASFDLHKRDTNPDSYRRFDVSDDQEKAFSLSNILLDDEKVVNENGVQDNVSASIHKDKSPSSSPMQSPVFRRKNVVSSISCYLDEVKSVDFVPPGDASEQGTVTTSVDDEEEAYLVSRTFSSRFYSLPVYTADTHFEVGQVSEFGNVTHENKGNLDNLKFIEKPSKTLLDELSCEGNESVPVLDIARQSSKYLKTDKDDVGLENSLFEHNKTFSNMRTKTDALKKHSGKERNITYEMRSSKSDSTTVDKSWNVGHLSKLNDLSDSKCITASDVIQTLASDLNPKVSNEPEELGLHSAHSEDKESDISREVVSDFHSVDDSEISKNVSVEKVPHPSKSLQENKTIFSVDTVAQQNFLEERSFVNTGSEASILFQPEALNKSSKTVTDHQSEDTTSGNRTATDVRPVEPSTASKTSIDFLSKDITTRTCRKTATVLQSGGSNIGSTTPTVSYSEDIIKGSKASDFSFDNRAATIFQEDDKKAPADFFSSDLTKKESKTSTVLQTDYVAKSNEATTVHQSKLFLPGQNVISGINQKTEDVSNMKRLESVPISNGRTCNLEDKSIGISPTSKNGEFSKINLQPIPCITLSGAENMSKFQSSERNRSMEKSIVEQKFMKRFVDIRESRSSSVYKSNGSYYNKRAVIAPICDGNIKSSNGTNKCLSDNINSVHTDLSIPGTASKGSNNSNTIDMISKNSTLTTESEGVTLKDHEDKLLKSDKRDSASTIKSVSCCKDGNSVITTVSKEQVVHSTKLQCADDIKASNIASMEDVAKETQKSFNSSLVDSIDVRTLSIQIASKEATGSKSSTKDLSSFESNNVVDEQNVLNIPSGKDNALIVNPSCNSSPRDTDKDIFAEDADKQNYIYGVKPSHLSGSENKRTLFSSKNGIEKDVEHSIDFIVNGNTSNTEETYDEHSRIPTFKRRHTIVNPEKVTVGGNQISSERKHIGDSRRKSWGGQTLYKSSTAQSSIPPSKEKQFCGFKLALNDNKTNSMENGETIHIPEVKPGFFHLNVVVMSDRDRLHLNETITLLESRSASEHDIVNIGIQNLICVFMCQDRSRRLEARKRLYNLSIKTPENLNTLANLEYIYRASHRTEDAKACRTKIKDSMEKKGRKCDILKAQCLLEQAYIYALLYNDHTGYEIVQERVQDINTRLDGLQRFCSSAETKLAVEIAHENIQQMTRDVLNIEGNIQCKSFEKRFCLNNYTGGMELLSSQPGTEYEIMIWSYYQAVANYLLSDLGSESARTNDSGPFRNKAAHLFLRVFKHLDPELKLYRARSLGYLGHLLSTTFEGKGDVFKDTLETFKISVTQQGGVPLFLFDKAKTFCNNEDDSVVLTTEARYHIGKALYKTNDAKEKKRSLDRADQAITKAIKALEDQQMNWYAYKLKRDINYTIFIQNLSQNETYLRQAKKAGEACILSGGVDDLVNLGMICNALATCQPNSRKLDTVTDKEDVLYEGLDYLQQAIERGVQSKMKIQCYTTLANSLFQLKQHRHAVECLKRVIEEDEEKDIELFKQLCRFFFQFYRHVGKDGAPILQEFLFWIDSCSEKYGEDDVIGTLIKNTKEFYNESIELLEMVADKITKNGLPSNHSMLTKIKARLEKVKQNESKKRLQKPPSKSLFGSPRFGKKKTETGGCVNQLMKTAMQLPIIIPQSYGSYDYYVFSSPVDLDWVMHVLRPALEESFGIEQLRGYLPGRDFVATDCGRIGPLKFAFARNLKIIIALSDDFVANEWFRYERKEQDAIKLLEEKASERCIIPVLLQPKLEIDEEITKVTGRDLIKPTDWDTIRRCLLCI